jgi:Zn-dependent protease with chaperone function
MVNLFFRSTLVLVLLFGLLFAVAMAVVVYFDLPTPIALAFAIGVLLLQYVLGPYILQWIYKIEWQDPKTLDPQLAEFIGRVCAERKIPLPRFGLIRDGNPNAFTFGHYPGDARLVVTTGVIDLLDADERKAVVGHELGHIAHWDFVVMTMAAAIPLMLYVLYIATRGGGKQKSRSAGNAGWIGLLSYAAYVVSQFIVMLLSRVREYYADQFSGEQTRNPDALSSALVKIAYGLARAPKEESRKDDARMVAGRAFGIFDPNVAQTLALTSAGSGAVSADSMENAMKWDLWNPWAGLFELSSSHPLPAKRIKALERQSEAFGQAPRFRFRAEQPESYWDEFLVDVFINWGLRSNSRGAFWAWSCSPGARPGGCNESFPTATPSRNSAKLRTSSARLRSRASAPSRARSKEKSSGGACPASSTPRISSCRMAAASLSWITASRSGCSNSSSAGSRPKT